MQLRYRGGRQCGVSLCFSSIGSRSDRDDDRSSRLPGCQICHGGGNFGQRVELVDERNLTVLEIRAQEREI
jgi:hypothetical protein